MDYRLKLVKYLIENSAVRSREYERMGIDNIRDMIDPDHWHIEEVTIPNKSGTDIIITRKISQNGSEERIKSPNPDDSFTIESKGSFGQNRKLAVVASDSILEHLREQGIAHPEEMYGEGAWNGLTDEEKEKRLKEWHKHFAATMQKSDLHIIQGTVKKGDNDELYMHIVHPHTGGDNIRPVVRDFLSHHNIGITHFLQNLSKSGSPLVLNRSRRLFYSFSPLLVNRGASPFTQRTVGSPSDYSGAIPESDSIPYDSMDHSLQNGAEATIRILRRRQGK